MNSLGFGSPGVTLCAIGSKSVQPDATAGRWRSLNDFLRLLYRLPLGVHLLLSFVFFYAIAFVLLFVAPSLLSLVSISIGLLGFFSGPVRRWLESRFGGEPTPTFLIHSRRLLFETIVARGGIDCNRDSFRRHGERRRLYSSVFLEALDCEHSSRIDRSDSFDHLCAFGT